jgi:hypothetical protein
MEMDRRQDTPKEDLICVGAQPLLRLLNELRYVCHFGDGMDFKERHNRLATLCHDLRTIIEKACPYRYPEHLAHESRGDGEADRLRKILDAIVVEVLRRR